MTTETVQPLDYERRDFVELTEDVSGSPLWNKDLAPTTIAQRTWSTWNIAALWIGMSVVISTYMIGASMIEAGMSWWQAMLTVLLGNVIVLIPMVLNAHAGTKYGISFPVLCRASFGTYGANIPAMLRAIVACGWFGIQTWIGGMAVDVLLGLLWGGWTTRLDVTIAGVALHTWIAFLIFWLIQVWIIINGIEAIKWLESCAAPLLLLGGVMLLWWAASKVGGLGVALDASTKLQRQDLSFWAIFPPFLTASVGYWATLSTNIPDFTRYARSQRSQMTGQALGLPTTMTAFAFIGIAVTSATMLLYGRAIWNPVELIQEFDSRLVIFFAGLIIVVAQLSTNMAANVVSPSNDFSHLSPRRISFIGGGLITAVIGIVMMPWKLLETAGDYIFTWLIGYSGLMGAIAGILICDYWLMRRQKLKLAEMYDTRGRYAYRGGFNPRAIIALLVAIAPCVPGFLNAATGGRIPAPQPLITVYTYSWFVTFAIGFALYGLLMIGHPNLPAKQED
jgi:nucleobase:cation symporter-1, NCS1 family